MHQKIIGIICAMDLEMITITKKIDNLTKEKILNYEFQIGDYLDNKIVIVKCGIGKVNAGIVSLLLIEHYNPDLVINSGIAGGYHRDLKPLDIVIAEKAIYSDVDMTTDAFTDLRYGQLQDLPLYFESDNRIISYLKSKQNLFFGSIMTGDQFVTDFAKTDQIVKKYFLDLNIIACDMESCAVAHCCYLTKTPFIVVRSISDIIGSTNSLDYQMFAPIAANNSANLVELIIKEIEI